jgi:hypothetical protein
VATADADAALPLAHEIEEDHTGLAGLALVRSVTSRITTTPPRARRLRVRQRRSTQGLR